MLSNLIIKPSSRIQYPFFPNLLKLIWIIWNLDQEKSYTGLTIFTIICLRCIQKWRGQRMKICLLCLPVLMKTKLKLRLKLLQVKIWDFFCFVFQFFYVPNTHQNLTGSVSFFENMPSMSASLDKNKIEIKTKAPTGKAFWKLYRQFFLGLALFESQTLTRNWQALSKSWK